MKTKTKMSRVVRSPKKNGYYAVAQQSKAGQKSATSERRRI